ncbi:acyl-CoA dehydratase activase [uncultured Dysosmobacter sp.]|uniref:acyl-CoA dehydratase activase n=1 Tax=uncultured Dysosmobacter sp. TaxID=2591384 RepID=UPI00262038AC|nr:acyl-CoA dehydratase activase [uncultured Dysosmobacter sp.]
MIGYTCKYTPAELLRAFGGDPVLLDGEEADFELAESLTHANLCCHAKALIQQGSRTDALIMMDCCDSLRRSYDVLSLDSRHTFLKLMDLPHENGQCARERFKQELLRLAAAYGGSRGTDFSRDAFLVACRESSQPLPNEPFLAVLGARVSPPLLDLIQKQLALPVVNLTCSGNRNLEAPPQDAENMDFDQLMDWYSGALLRMIPCMRMTSVAGRKELTNHPQLKGIVYNTVKFCDFYSFDYAALKRETAIPILKIESDYMPQPSGQLSTRLEAFSESLLPERSHRRTPMNKTTERAASLYAGIDSGSTTTNMVVINEKKEILASAIVRTGAKAQNGAKAALEEVCRQLSVQPEAFAAIMATGYGRSNIPFATDTKTEITCHARGAFFLNPAIRTIVDIGGQDSKVICLDENGAVTNFIMNDKCAAGTGRFLEMMARTLELDMDQMSRQGLTWKKDLTISSMCTVFAESEVISLIADNHTDSDIIHGLNKSIAAKTASMVSRAKGTGPYMMTGGVARNKGVVQALEARLGENLYITDAPDLCGAIGAALFALEES